MSAAVDAALAGFDTARVLRETADRETATLRVKEGDLTAALDRLQTEYEGKAAELDQVRGQMRLSQQTGDSWSDAMDAYDTVLRLNGIEREQTP